VTLDRAGALGSKAWRTSTWQRTSVSASATGGSPDPSSALSPNVSHGGEIDAGRVRQRGVVLGGARDRFDDAGPRPQPRERRRISAFGYQDERRVRHGRRYSETGMSETFHAGRWRSPPVSRATYSRTVSARGGVPARPIPERLGLTVDRFGTRAHSRAQSPVYANHLGNEAHLRLWREVPSGQRLHRPQLP
jgi:hypothetical protein